MASTGVIGVRLPMEKVRAGIAEAGRRISRHAGADAARAIMTTDTKPKEVAVEFPVGDATCVVGGMAKGAGMIAPNMATMLAFFTTDAAVEPALLRRALVEAVGESLNRITVDGDTSTNDCADRARERRAPRSRHRPRGPRLRRLPRGAHRGGAASSPGCWCGTERVSRASPRCGWRARERRRTRTASPAPWPSRRS